MIEVEAKIKISSPEKYRILVSKIAKHIKTLKKTDDYYTLQSLKTYPKKSLRIRKTKDKYEINFKQHLSYVNGIHAKNEQEFTTSDINNFLNLIKDFGFKKWLTKIKHSEVYEINKNFHIEINKVNNLGWFIEIEYLAKPNQIKPARTQISKVIKQLNLNKESIIKEGYTKLLWNRTHHL
jgi:predicted adenylyl cyclase CyaB